MKQAASSPELTSLGACPTGSWRVSGEHADLVRPAQKARPILVDAEP
jgi:hypothetical protein